MPYSLRLLDTHDGTPHQFSGMWLVFYDPDYHWDNGNYDGGFLIAHEDASKAQRFDSPSNALNYWSLGPVCNCHRLRDDGSPNRPLTAFNCELIWTNE